VIHVKQPLDSNRIHRLNRFVEELSDAVGNDKRLVVDKYRADLDAVTPIELLSLKLFSDPETGSLQTVLETAGKWTNVFHRGLSGHPSPNPSHPLLEKEADEARSIQARLDEMKPMFGSHSFEQDAKRLIAALADFETAERRLLRYEYVLFPRLEDKLPSNKPLKVLWLLHDRLRHVRCDLMETLNVHPSDVDGIRHKIGTFYLDWVGLLEKQKLILLPVAQDELTPSEWDAMTHSMEDIGYAFQPILQTEQPQAIRAPMSAVYETTTGSLSFEQLDLLLGALPIDITYVDETDTVRYFNETGRRFFPRTAEVIGRPVTRCHPDHSIRYVLEILAKFRQGEASKASFWIRFKERLLLITYFAVRDKENRYRGVLECTQDITDLKSLQGERRLADWDR
jgi:PAS domain S-box-containing protein